MGSVDCAQTRVTISQIEQEFFGTGAHHWSLFASCNPSPSRPTVLPHVVFSFICVLITQVKGNVILCCCYNSLAALFETPAAYFRAVCYNYVSFLLVNHKLFQRKILQLQILLYLYQLTFNLFSCASFIIFPQTCILKTICTIMKD